MITGQSNKHSRIVIYVFQSCNLGLYFKIYDTYLQCITFKEPELKTEVKPELPGCPKISKLIALAGQLLQGGLDCADRAGSVHLNGDTIRPEN